MVDYVLAIVGLLMSPVPIWAVIALIREEEALAKPKTGPAVADCLPKTKPYLPGLKVMARRS